MITLESLIKVFVCQLVTRARDKPDVACEANENLARFMKDCLTYMDRGYIFRMVNTVKDQYGSGDAVVSGVFI